MKTLLSSRPRAASQKGLALIIVVSMLALATLLLLALFSSAQTEMKSTVVASSGTAARLAADSAVSIAIGQLQAATRQDGNTPGIETWASQPGMVRQYRQDGVLLRGSKLYSDQKMVATTDLEIAQDTPPVDWDKRPTQYVDMNQPVARRNPRRPSEPPQWFFPIIDPRSYSSDPRQTVEGFSYSAMVNGSSGGNLAGVVLPGTGGGDADSQRVPMPVEWLYLLQDGTLGYLTDDGTFVGAGGVKATRANPIVSRLAFWTDDESCKININTAGEGTAWGTPSLFHTRDGDWARFQPMANEYQRYPGHPATVCMSTVLFPGENMNPLSTDSGQMNKAMQFKETIYDLMPKILPGGSKAGTVLVPAGRNFTPTDFVKVQEALHERLFATVDEFLLRPAVGSGNEREEVNLQNSGAWGTLSRAQMMERIRPFLTARSRASEVNPFGFPKISMWPEHRTATPDYRTVFDRTIAYCSTLSGKDYYFTRQDCTSQLELTQIARNKQLYDHLLAMLSLPIPGFGYNSSATFENKYGDNLKQILVEMFDYIRSTNLYDETIAEATVGSAPAIPGLPTARTTAHLASGGLKSKTFTPMRTSASIGSYPGHGQVTPTVLPRSTNSVYRGMGRFLTISEAGLQFIATAEGTDTAGGKSAPKITPKTPPPAANYTPPTWRGNGSATVLNWDQSNNWYSNFPPLTGANQDPASGFYNRYLGDKATPEGKGATSPEHPGYNPMNWNWTLNKDTPLPDKTKRVQATFLLEWFCPSTGWTLINPDIAIEVDASALSVGGKKLFPTNGGKTFIRPFQHMSNAWGIYTRGGTISYRAFLQDRKLPGVAAGVNGIQNGSIKEDKNYTQYASQSDARLKNCNQYNLVSDFFDVPADGPIPFDGGNVIVRIYRNVTVAPSGEQPLQVFTFNFPKANFPAPILATKNEDTSWGQYWDGSWWVKQPVPPPFWWSFHADGALGRDKNGDLTAIAADNKTRMGGRFRFIGNEIGSYGDVPSGGTYNRGNLVIPDDCLQSLVLRHGDPRLTMGQYLVAPVEFEAHRYYGKERLAHNIVLAHWSEGPGLDRGEDKKGWRLVKDANYHNSFLPDHPYSPATGAGLQKYGDFSRGVANQTDGAYINKPDEGNTYGPMNNTTGEQGVPYFTDPWVTWMGGSTYFSPNRQVASPGMFGCLPTGVHDAGASPAGRKREPWRTLLFRPQTWSIKNNQQFHIGSPSRLKGYGASGLAIQGLDPADYLFMDFFWMPVVEPYAISQPGSTAGKINLNYQIAPFRHIRRATALGAVMKSELVTAVDFDDANFYLRRPSGAPANQGQAWFAKDDTDTYYDNKNYGRKFWHRQVDTEATLKLFDERFSSGFVFLSPAQICEMHLLPKKTGTADNDVPSPWPDKLVNLLKANSPDSILTFWEKHAVTAENLKERPYTNMYPRLTTKSNTYQVFYRAQVITKARSSDPAKFVPDTDSVGAEYRGSAIIERYLDLNDPQLKNIDYAVGTPASKTSLDEFHRVRVISQKRFDP